MRQNFRFIIFGMVLIIFYELYLILYHKYNEYQSTRYTEYVTRENEKLTDAIAEKESYNVYIRTPAYQTRIAKASQGKKLPGEEVINIIASDDAERNVSVNVGAQIESAERTNENPTKGMSNPEKWIYYLTKHVEKRD